MIRIEIDIDNDAFRPEAKEGWRPETAWLLHDLADRILTGQALPAQLRDYNGNTVGRAELDPSETISPARASRE